MAGHAAKEEAKAAFMRTYRFPARKSRFIYAISEKTGEQMTARNVQISEISTIGLVGIVVAFKDGRPRGDYYRLENRR